MGDLWGAADHIEMDASAMVCDFYYNIVDLDFKLASRQKWLLQADGSYGVVRGKRLFCGLACASSYRRGDEKPPMPDGVEEYLREKTRQRGLDLPLLQCRLHLEAEEAAASKGREEYIQQSRQRRGEP